MNDIPHVVKNTLVSAGCHINDVMNLSFKLAIQLCVSAGCHINDVMNNKIINNIALSVSAGCHINDVMNKSSLAKWHLLCFSWMSYQ